MRRALLTITALLILFLPSQLPAHRNHGNGGSQEEYHLPLSNFPVVPLEIHNDSDVFVVIYLNNLCSPRIALRPGESVIITNCFKQGLRYQGVVIFYTNEVPVLERFHIFASVRPGEPWVFCKLPPGEKHCPNKKIEK